MSFLTYGAILSFLSSTLVVLGNKVEVIRHNGSNPVADAFSVPKCFVSYCKALGTTCYDGGCCKCKCPHEQANYIVNEKKCLSRDELNQMNSTKCEYSIRKPSVSLLAIPLTEGMVQNVSFTDREDHRTIIECSSSVQVGWEYRDAFGEWKEGEGNIFTVISYDKPGSNNQRVIETLEWTGNINSFYAGLLIRLLFKCENKVQGCALAKTSGQHTYDTTSTEKPPPVIILTTASTNPVTTSSTPVPSTTRTTENNTKTNQGDDETPAPNKDNAAVIYGSIFGALGLICIIVVVIVVVIRYRKKKQNQKDREANSVANLEEYKDPIYDDIKGNFDNPMYSDPTLNLKRAQLGPLPNIPGSEAPSTLTRTSPDYDNPPFGMQSNSDYDNPPIRGGKRRTGSNYNSPVEDNMDSTGDHDNPPVRDGLENSQHYDIPPRKKDDYDSQSELGEDTAL